MGHTEIVGSGEDQVKIRRLTPAEHGRVAEGMDGLVESQFELFIEEVEQTAPSENMVRLATMNVMIARAQVHATLATAPDFYAGPPADAEEVDTSRQHDVATDRVDPFDDPDTDRPGQYL